MKRGNSSVVHRFQRHHLYLLDAATLADVGGMIQSSAVEIALRSWPPPITDPETLSISADTDAGDGGWPQISANASVLRLRTWGPDKGLDGIGTAWDVVDVGSFDWVAPGRHAHACVSMVRSCVSAAGAQIGATSP